MGGQWPAPCLLLPLLAGLLHSHGMLPSAPAPPPHRITHPPLTSLVTQDPHAAWEGFNLSVMLAEQAVQPTLTLPTATAAPTPVPVAASVAAAHAELPCPAAMPAVRRKASVCAGKAAAGGKDMVAPRLVPRRMTAEGLLAAQQRGGTSVGVAVGVESLGLRPRAVA